MTENMENMTPQQLEQMADQLLTENAEAAGKPEEKKGEAKKNKGGKLDEKAIAALPAAELLGRHEKLKDLFVRAKKKGNVHITELEDLMDELELTDDQIQQVYESLEMLEIEQTNDDLLAGLPDDVEPPMEEIAEIEEEELVDPNTLAASLENTPRLTPARIVPTRPPKAARGVNAARRIPRRIPGSSGRRSRRIQRQPST